jgi:hypothetical protein
MLPPSSRSRRCRSSVGVWNTCSLISAPSCDHSQSSVWSQPEPLLLLILFNYSLGAPSLTVECCAAAFRTRETACSGFAQAAYSSFSTSWIISDHSVTYSDSTTTKPLPLHFISFQITAYIHPHKFLSL